MDLERYRKLHLRIRIVAGFAALLGALQIGFFVFVLPLVAELIRDPTDAFDFKVAARMEGLLISGLLNLTCAAFLWRRRSLVAAYVLAVWVSLNAVYVYTLGRNGGALFSVGCAFIYALAIFAIHEIRKDTPAATTSPGPAI